jgi:hypothetical protein
VARRAKSRTTTLSSRFGHDEDDALSAGIVFVLCSMSDIFFRLASLRLAADVDSFFLVIVFCSYRSGVTRVRGRKEEHCLDFKEERIEEGRSVVFIDMVLGKDVNASTERWEE